MDPERLNALVTNLTFPNPSQAAKTKTSSTPNPASGILIETAEKFLIIRILVPKSRKQAPVVEGLEVEGLGFEVQGGGFRV